MDFKQLMANKPLFYSIIGAIVVVFAIILLLAIMQGSKNSGGVPVEKPIKGPLELLTTDNLGKAIEIQALLAREGITAERKPDGSKSTLILLNYTPTQRDRALLTIVKSGLMDQNVGLEIFDKGDFTSTKDDKRIRLARAINGELARLIKKIDPITNASVFVSIPEQTMFSSMQKPITATVQITIPPGDKLDNIKIKAITNLLLGSVTGLLAENIAITDTNGNVYSSIIGANDKMLEKLEENDKYMQQKVNTQLDRLIGKGNYIATVSTYLKQAPVEKFSILYDPEQRAAISEQTFTEGLGDNASDNSRTASVSNAVSVYLPNGVPGGGIGGGNSASQQSREYSRRASEAQYGVSKTQINEYQGPGMVEEISIAVTIEKNSTPAETSLEELKELIARAASPKASAANVTIAFSDTIDPYLASERPASLPIPEDTGNPWWLAIALILTGLGGTYYVVSTRVKQAQERQRQELLAMKEYSDEQLRTVGLQTAQLSQQQSQLAQDLIASKQNIEYASLPTSPAQASIPMSDMAAALQELRAGLEAVDAEELGENIKSWIEAG